MIDRATRSPTVARRLAKKLPNRRFLDTLTGLLFVLPALAIVVIVLIYPVAFNFNLATRSWSWFSLPEERGAFVGLGNFQHILESPRFTNALKVTSVFMVLAIGVEYFLGLGIALVLQSEFKGRRVFRTLFMLPMMIAPVVVAIQWRYLLSGNFGVINYLIGRLGLIPPSWLSQPGLALWAVVFVDAWTYVPFIVVVLLAGLQTIPVEMYDAAKVDGASTWHQIRFITLPLLKPASALALLVRATDVFRTFDLIYILTGGGPAYSTEVLGLYAYRVAFSEGELGRAAALAVIIAIIGMVIGAALINVIKTETRLV
jgi:multiple sugar transport system permease protein